MNSLANILICFLATYALVFFLQHKALFLRGKLSFLDDLLDCSFCLGLWAGFASWTFSWWADGGTPVFGSGIGSPIQIFQPHALIWTRWLFGY